MVSESAQLNVVEVGTGIVTLVTSEEARSQLWTQLTTLAGEVGSGNTFVMGRIAGNLVPLGTAGKLGRGARIASMTDKATSALNWGKNALGSARVVIANTADTVKHALASTRDDFLNALGNAEKKLGEVGQNLRPAPALAGVGTLPPGTPVTDALTRLFRTTDTPTTPRTNFEGGGPAVSDEFAPAAQPSAEVRSVRGKTEALDPFDPNHKGALLPNVIYRASAPGTNHNYVYETNSHGLIDRVVVDVLHLKPKRPRLTNDRNTPGKLPGDDAGHLVADMFDGDPTLRNLVSQAWKLNRGAGSEWAAMERVWRDALTEVPPKAVTNIEIRVLYDSNKRPTGFEVDYEVAGEFFSAPFPNPK